MTTTQATPAISLDTTVNQALERVPGAGLVFNLFGVDTCCGGDHSLREAAIAASLRPEILFSMLVQEGERAAHGAGPAR